MPPPPHIKPENVLKRAQELIAVEQPQAALNVLHEHVTSKRSRSSPIASLEPVLLQFFELCVDLRKGKSAKDGLYQYKNIAQNTNVGTIELVLKRFIELAEKKVTEAQEKAEQVQTTLDTATVQGAINIEDLEATETPETILLATVSGEQSKDRTDRAIVTPWQILVGDVPHRPRDPQEQFPEPFQVTPAMIEKFIMNGCKKGDLAIRLDHVSGVLTFDNDVFSAKTVPAGSAPGSAESESVQRLQNSGYVPPHLRNRGGAPAAESPPPERIASPANGASAPRIGGAGGWRGGAPSMREGRQDSRDGSDAPAPTPKPRTGGGYVPPHLRNK